jgi:hypothetical protein
MVRDVLKKATVQAVLAFLLVATFCALALKQGEMTDMIFGATMAILTYYFVKEKEA